jgi:hypothetical protein
MRRSGRLSVDNLVFTKRTFSHGVYHYTLSITRLSDNPPVYRASLDRSSADLSQTARVTDRQYTLPGSPQLYTSAGDTAVTTQLLNYLQKVIQDGHPLPDELPLEWYRQAT